MHLDIEVGLESVAAAGASMLGSSVAVVGSPDDVGVESLDDVRDEGSSDCSSDCSTDNSWGVESKTPTLNRENQERWRRENTHRVDGRVRGRRSCRQKGSNGGLVVAIASYKK